MKFSISAAAAAAVVVLVICITEIQGHGMMLDPPGRSSRWRYDSSAPKNYNDNALYCGGFANQWYTHNGNCGLCGDDYGSPPPRANEIGGYYGGVGVITKTYTGAYTANVGVQITANHLGYIYYNLCNLDVFGAESEECFQKIRLRFADGSDKFHVGSTVGWIGSTIVWPEGLNCERCVLRWTYNAGNNWGTCENGSGAMGCGAQENFKSCADISVRTPAPTSKLLKALESSEPELPIAVEGDAEE